MGRSRDLQGSGVAGALQSLRRSGGISASRSPLVHALSRFGAGGCGSRRQDSVALSRGAGQGGAVEELFDLFDGFLKDKGYLAMGGQIIDASIVSAPNRKLLFAAAFRQCRTVALLAASRARPHPSVALSKIV